jgi:hypothetical protein
MALVASRYTTFLVKGSDSTDYKVKTEKVYKNLETNLHPKFKKWLFDV